MIKNGSFLDLNLNVLIEDINGILWLIVMEQFTVYLFLPWTSDTKNGWISQVYLITSTKKLNKEVPNLICFSSDESFQILLYYLKLVYNRLV